MTEQCADLDEFFDGELPAGQADAFRGHLPACDRCQRVLHGRMQEDVAVRMPAARFGRAASPAMELLVAPAVMSVAAPPPRTAEPVPRPRPRKWSRAVAYAAPLLAAAAAIPIYLAHRADPEFELALTVDRAPTTERSRATGSRRSVTAHPGDVVRPSVHGERYRAIRVYLEEHRLVAACPEDARCRDAGGELTLELRLDVPGKYVIVGLGSSDPLAVPGATYEQTLIAARRAGIYTQIQRLDVE